jgi:hypothetical protein
MVIFNRAAECWHCAASTTLWSAVAKLPRFIFGNSRESAPHLCRTAWVFKVTAAQHAYHLLL